MLKTIGTLSLAAALLATPARSQTLQQQTAPYGGVSGQGATGPAVSGFSLSLSTRTPSASLHGPLWVTVEARNVSGRLQHVAFGARATYEFSVIDTKTHLMVTRNNNSPFGADPFLGFRSVPSGSSMYGEFRLDEMYRFTGPGTYSVQVTRGQISVNYKAVVLKSNVITVTLVP